MKKIMTYFILVGLVMVLAFPINIYAQGTQTKSRGQKQIKTQTQTQIKSQSQNQVKTQTQTKTQTQIKGQYKNQTGQSD